MSLRVKQLATIEANNNGVADISVADVLATPALTFAVWNRCVFVARLDSAFEPVSPLWASFVRGLLSGGGSWFRKWCKVNGCYCILSVCIASATPLRLCRILQPAMSILNFRYFAILGRCALHYFSKMQLSFISASAFLNFP